MIVVKRKIGSIALDVTVSEKHSDTLEITQFPVLSGAVISDHAYKLPMQLTIKAGQGTGPSQTAYGVDPSTIITADIPNDNGKYTFEEDDSYTLLGGDVNRPTKTYMSLLALQATRQPFTVITGKRIYKNMLLKNITVTTDQDTENVLMLSADLQEIIIVATVNYGETSVLVKAQQGPENMNTQSTNPLAKSTLKSLSEGTPEENWFLKRNQNKKSDDDWETITPGKNSSSVPLPNNNELNQLTGDESWLKAEKIRSQLGVAA